MEEDLNENELEERFYSMLHYVDDSQANNKSDQDALKILESAPRSTLRRYWRTSGDHPTPKPLNTPFQKVNTPKPAPTAPTPPTPPINTPQPKPEKCNSPVEPLPKHLSIFQIPPPLNLKRTVEILDVNDDVVECVTSDEDEVIEVALPPKPTITIESSDDECIPEKPTPEADKSSKDREISASPVPSIVSSVSDEFIRGDCIAFNISSHQSDNHSFDFSLHGSDILSTPSKKKKKKKNKECLTSTPIISTPINTTPNKTVDIEGCFATPKSKAKNKKKAKSYTVTDKIIPNADAYDSDSNQSSIDINKDCQSYVVTEKSLPCADVYETDSNPTEAPKIIEKSKSSLNKNKENSDINVSHKVTQDDTLKTSNTTKDSVSQTMQVTTIDLTENTVSSDPEIEIEENIVIANVSGLTDAEDCVEILETNQNSVIDIRFGSTKVPAILYENLDFDNLKGKEKVCKNRRYSLTTLRAEMEKFYNESWGGENFNHREIQKNMSRDKSLWAIDPKDRMPSLTRKKYNTTCNYCNRPGHRDDTCYRKPAVCYMCGNSGHMEPRCPSKICVNCGSPNHMYSTLCRACAHWPRLACGECGRPGHPASHCPDVWRRYHNTTDLTCKLTKADSLFTRKQLYCSGCTRRGHLVHSCRISLPFSGLPMNSPYVHLYNPVYFPITPQNPTKSQPDSTIPNPRNETPKRQSKSPTVHESHENKKRHVSMSEVTGNESSAPRERQRGKSESKEPAQIEETPQNQNKTQITATSESTEAPDFIPIFSSNHDKQGQVIQDNEVSDTSDIVTSAKIFVTTDILNKLKTKEGEEWLKETTTKLHVTVEMTESNFYLTIKGKVPDQDSFQNSLREFVKVKPTLDQNQPKPESDAETTQQLSENQLSQNIPKNKNNMLRKLSKALESLNDDLGEPNAIFKELNFLQDKHEHLLKQKTISPQQLVNNRGHINEMLKKLNMVLVGQAGLGGGSQHVRQLRLLQARLVNYRQKNISKEMREEIGTHFQCIFTALPRSDYDDLLRSFNIRQQRQRMFVKKNKSFEIHGKPKKFNTIPNANQQKKNPTLVKKSGVDITNSEVIGKEKGNLRKPLVDKTSSQQIKLAFYHKRLLNACPNDRVLKKTRMELVKRIRSHIAAFSKDVVPSAKSLRRMRRVQEQAQLFLNNV